MLAYLGGYIHPDAIKLLKQHGEITDTFDRIRETGAIVLRTASITRDITSQASSLKVIVKHDVGCNTIDLEAAKEYKIPVINTPKADTNSVAELIIGPILNVCRDIASCNAKSRHRGFGRIALPEMTGIKLTGKTIGLVGVSDTALRTGGILKNGLGTVPVGYNPYCTAEQAVVFGIRKYNDLNKILEVSNIVNISVPLTPSTKNLIAGDPFLHFKKNAVLIDAVRGDIANEDDLYTALKTGQLRAAVCDAFVKESPTGENKLTKLNSFCAAPHIGADTEEALYRMGMEVVKAVIEAIEGNAAEYRAV